MRKCYISYKFEDEYYKNKIVEKYAGVEFVDKSQKFEIDSNDPEYIMQQIREKYLKDSTVTIFLIGEHSSENYRDYKDRIQGLDSQIIIRREITASLYEGNGNTRNGLLGVVLPEMERKIYKGLYQCPNCGEEINYVALDDDTVIKEFWQNYYLKEHKNGCSHFSEEDRYAVLVRYSEFMESPEEFIEKAFKKRNMPIAKNVRVRKFKEPVHM